MSTIFDCYYLIDHIARKQKHDVYLASHLDTPEHRVILKVFDAECLLPEITLHDFDDITKRLQQLVHPSILPFYALGIEQRKLYVVHSYVSGESLRVYLERSHQLHFSDAVEIVTHVGEAVAFAHSQQIIHQAIRPENIFFDALGKPLLTDFRLPYLMYEDGLTSDSATSLMSYQAPEQFAGVLHPAIDQYALGCLLYELITGTCPFPSLDTAIQAQKTQQRFIVPVVSTVVGDLVPEGIEEVLLRALASRPEDRYDSVVEFLTALHATQQPAPPKFPFAHLTEPVSPQPTRVEREAITVPTASLQPPVFTEYVADQEDLQLTSQASTTRYASAQAHADMQSAILPVEHDLSSQQPPTRQSKNTIKPTVVHPPKRRSQLLLVLAAIFVVISALLSSIAYPPIVQALNKSAATVASTSHASQTPTAPASIPANPTPTSTQKAHTKPSRTPASQPHVTPTATRTKPSTPKPQPTATLTVSQPQPTAVPGKTPTPTSVPATPTPSPALSCAGLAAWKSGVAYTGGSKVTYNDALWQAKWWTENDVPGGSAGVWTSDGTC